MSDTALNSYALAACTTVWLHPNGEPVREDGRCWWCGSYRGIPDREGRRDRSGEEKHKDDCPWAYLINVFSKVHLRESYRGTCFPAMERVVKQEFV